MSPNKVIRVSLVSEDRAESPSQADDLGADFLSLHAYAYAYPSLHAYPYPYPSLHLASTTIGVVFNSRWRARKSWRWKQPDQVHLNVRYLDILQLSEGYLYDEDLTNIMNFISVTKIVSNRALVVELCRGSYSPRHRELNTISIARIFCQ